VRYVGALSRKLDNAPVAQKNCQGWVSPSSSPRASRMARAGIIVAKIPAKMIATSWIGAQENSFSSRGRLGPNVSERAIIATYRSSRRYGKPIASPALVSGPERMVVTTTPPRKTTFSIPIKRMGTYSARSAAATRAGSRR